jgi:hypothetical protein
MKRSPLLEFNSAAFPTVLGEERQTNPGVSGKSLAVWVGDRLRLAHFDIGDILAEDFGWCVPIKANPYSIYVACASTGVETP